MLTFDVIASDTIVFQGLNLYGSVGILVDAWLDKNYQLVALNIIWGIVALIGLISSLF